MDNFVIGCMDREIAEDIIDIINNNMTIKIKHLGIITRFNGVNIMRIQNYINVSNATYFHKILKDKHDPK